MSESAEPDTSMRALLRQGDFVRFWFCRWTAVLAVQITSIALGWQIYEIARRTMDVKPAALVYGMIGLIAFVPVLFLALPAGEVADRHNRRTILKFTYSAEILIVGILAAAAFFHFATVPFLLGAAALFGATRAFFAPANTALGPMLVPRELLPRAIAWQSLAWQTAAIFGPALGGALVAISPGVAYSVALGLYVIAFVLVVLIRSNAQPVVQPGSRWALMKEGLAYVWNNKIVFGAISLDLFAVLLGGAVLLLPIFAKDVLHVGALGFGMLRAAPALGASAVAIWLGFNPIRKHAGVIMFSAVGLFGVGTVAFGGVGYMATHDIADAAVLQAFDNVAAAPAIFYTALCLACLTFLGGADMISVYVRQTLVQLATPDHMRGRVATVSSLFIGASNELGEFETGIVTRFLGPVGAALFGGVGAIAVTAIWAKLFPDLRKADRLA
jgi:MFS family permease